MMLVLVSLVMMARSTVTPPPATVSPPAEKMICRTADVIGSRVRKRKVCMSAGQWNRVGASARDIGQAMQDRMTSGSPQ